MAFEVSPRLDDTDWKLLAELQEDGRASYSELGRRVALTAPAVAERIRRLEESGVIKRFRAEVDPTRLGYPITAFVRWTSTGPDCAHLGEVAKEIPEVLECHRITGETSYTLKVAATSVGHLEQLIDRLMPYGSTITSVVLSSSVLHRPIRQPQEDAAEVPATRTG
ncbi:MAG: Lrp/AsnC family transcriptional regulator, partial [Actinomycetota bacterium]|nr:Lrp/AsnC family transcriptional regulator [Actinomycetota bacterium]